MPIDPISQSLDIPDRETALRRLELLTQNILRLRADIPDMAQQAKILQQYLQGMDDDAQSALALVERLIERQRTWEEWLRGRLTLLANLREYLTMANNKRLAFHTNQDWEEEIE